MRETLTRHLGALLRLDRIRAADLLAESFRPAKGRTLDDFFAHYERE